MKNLSKIVLTAAFLAFAVGQLSAQDNTAATGDNTVSKLATTTGQNCGKFTDANKDGICDNAPSHTGNAKGANFVDANGDGVCDHRTDGAVCQGNGTCCKGTCQQKQNCPKEQQNCCGKGMGTQQKHSCASQCPGKTPQDKK